MIKMSMCDYFIYGIYEFFLYKKDFNYWIKWGKHISYII